MLHDGPFRPEGAPSPFAPVPPRRPARFDAALLAEIPWLRAVCRGLAKADQHRLADDLVQETVSRALAGWQEFDGASLRPWLGTIARNLFLNQMRHEARVRHDDVSLAHAIGLDPAQEAHLALHDALAAIERLNATQRASLVRAALGDPLAAIAADLALSEGAVKASVSKGRAALAAALDGRKERPR